mmetsp:Transcript_2823/g.6879  ORF Transcript_2823/g.6879 Transcript_2823/m.6879 type:complete len:107 (+) Transcript_2823:46-366(+)
MSTTVIFREDLESSGPYHPCTAWSCWAAGLIGLCGLHRCYLGQCCVGACYFFTLGVCGVGQCLDGCQMSELVRTANVEAGCSDATVVHVTHHRHHFADEEPIYQNN